LRKPGVLVEAKAGPKVSFLWRITPARLRPWGVGGPGGESVAVSCRCLAWLGLSAAGWTDCEPVPERNGAQLEAVDEGGRAGGGVIPGSVKGGEGGLMKCRRAVGGERRGGGGGFHVSRMASGGVGFFLWIFLDGAGSCLSSFPCLWGFGVRGGGGRGVREDGRVWGRGKWCALRVSKGRVFRSFGD